MVSAGDGGEGVVVGVYQGCQSFLQSQLGGWRLQVSGRPRKVEGSGSRAVENGGSRSWHRLQRPEARPRHLMPDNAWTTNKCTVRR